ncbi:MAG: response regulator [Streptomycetales bacterium]
MERVKILLVDDRQDNLLALEATLSSLDQILVRAGSGDEALKALLVEDFAVILLDVQMPGLDGFETASRIKQRAKTKDIPIIFLTAYNQEPHDAFRGYAAGAVDYISKPFDPWVLRAKVTVFVDLHKKNRQLREQAELLRHHLQPVGGGLGDELVGELRARLAAVEEQVDAFRAHSRSASDAGVEESICELERRVGRLRAALDAMSVDA